MKLNVVLLSLVACLLFNRPAYADLITWEATGLVNSAGTIYEPVFPDGALWTFRISFETDGAGLVIPELGSYRFSPADPLQITSTVAGYEYTGNARNFTWLHVSPTPCQGCPSSLFVDSSLAGGTMTGDVAGGIWYPFALDVSFVWDTPFRTTDLPTTPPVGGQFTFYLFPDPRHHSGPSLRGTITDVSAVPEPATLWLVGFGLAGALVRARARHHRPTREPAPTR
jgi:PEP-CTERM motif